MNPVSPLHRAADLIQKYPLSLLNHGGSWIERGFFAGLDECIGALDSIVSAKLGEGAAFGRPWPFLEFEENILAPALSVAVSATETMAPDGAYQRRDSIIERESAGLVEKVLILHPGSDSPGSPFDLLWFAENERFVLEGPWLTISSLFAVFRVTAGRRTLDRMLRFFNFGEDPLAHWKETTASTEPTSVSVGRTLRLISEDRWKEPDGYLASRPDVKKVQRASSSFIVTGIDDEATIYQRKNTATGWILELLEGRSLYPRIVLNLTSEHIILTADLDPSLDAARPEVRARIAFDLNADLQKL